MRTTSSLAHTCMHERTHRNTQASKHACIKMHLFFVNNANKDDTICIIIH